MGAWLPVPLAKALGDALDAQQVKIVRDYLDGEVDAMKTATLVFTTDHLYAIADALDFALAHEPDAEADEALTMVRAAIAEAEAEA